MASPAAFLVPWLALLAVSAYARVIPGEFVVELNGECTSQCRGELRRALLAAGLQTCQVVDRVAVIKSKSWGFISCTDRGLSAQALSQRLVEQADNTLAPVIRVDADMVVSKIQKPCKGNRCSPATDPPTSGLEPPKLPTAVWGVDQVDGTPNNERCPLTSNVGAGVDAYVMDTGCVPTDGAMCTSEFRVKGRQSACADGDGHGTHVAGTINDPVYGVAPAATRHCVKVLSDSGSGSVSGIVNAISRVVIHHADQRSKDAGRKAVVNMSLGGGFNEALNNAVNTASDESLYFTLAAGNEGKDACETSPASATVNDDFSFSVAAHNASRIAASWSNRGVCTDLSAPGVNIISTNGVTFSGTSMAAPHVAGAIAVILSDGTTPDSKGLLYSITDPEKTIAFPGSLKPILKIKC